MIFGIGGNDHFFIIILLFLEKHNAVNMVWFLQQSVPSKDAFSKSVEYHVQAQTAQQHHCILFKLYFGTHIFPVTNIVPPGI